MMTFSEGKLHISFKEDETMVCRSRLAARSPPGHHRRCASVGRPHHLDGVPALHRPDLAEVVGGQVRSEELDDRLDPICVLLLVDVTCRCRVTEAGVK